VLKLRLLCEPLLGPLLAERALLSVARPHRFQLLAGGAKRARALALYLSLPRVSLSSLSHSLFLSLSLSLFLSRHYLYLSLSLSLSVSLFFLSLSLYIYIIPLLPSSFPPLSSTVVTKSTPNRVTAPGFAQTCACCVDMLRHGQRLLQYRLPCGACFKVGFFLTARWNCWKIFEPLLTPEIVAALRSFIS
jgi:hypothetical protein